MKIKINASGCLEIERAGEWKEQSCPYGLAVPAVTPLCGDWCPLFGGVELRQTSAEGPDRVWRPILVQSLPLCRRTIFGEIIDERVKEPRP